MGVRCRMSSQKAGLNFEHEIANGVFDRTGGRLLPLRVGWSGNQKVPSPDVVLDDGDLVHAFEFKRTTQDRISITFSPETPEEDRDDDLSDLLRFANDYPRKVAPAVGIRFTNRQLLLLRIWPADNDEKLRESMVETAPVEAKVTRAGNISVPKPPTDTQATTDEQGWPSSQVGDDFEYLLDYINW